MKCEEPGKSFNPKSLWILESITLPRVIQLLFNLLGQAVLLLHSSERKVDLTYCVTHVFSTVPGHQFLDTWGPLRTSLSFLPESLHDFTDSSHISVILFSSCLQLYLTWFGVI